MEKITEENFKLGGLDPFLSVNQWQGKPPSAFNVLINSFKQNGPVGDKWESVDDLTLIFG